MRALIVAVFLIASGFASAQTPLQPLVDGCNARPCVINLADGIYDDLTPVVIAKTVTIRGSRNAIIHSEFQVIDGATAHLIGVTLEMNKVGAIQHDGYSGDVFPQNGMFVVLNSALWLDDVDMRTCSPNCPAGLTLNKAAVYAIGGVIHLRTVTKLSRVDWRGNAANVMELYYGSYANVFDVSGQGLTFGIASEMYNGAPAIMVASSRLVLSGAHMYRFGSSTIGVKASRNSYVQCGAGLATSIQFPTPILDDGTSNFIYRSPAPSAC
jgi:hypothetical protein